jgi:hypothetical protein
MQYHLGYPGADPIFEQNSADPTARAAYYGIANTQNLIPRAYVDGQSGGNLIGNWSTQKFLRRTLDTSPFTLDVSTLPAGPSHIQVQMTINPIQNVPTVGQTTPNLVAHFALVQKTVGSNKYVVRKLIPNAIGTPIALPLLKDVPYTVQPEPWLVNVSGMDLSDLAIIGFVQDIDTKEVYQSFVLADPTNLPTVVTGVEPLEISGIQMYPNPVDNELQVELADNASADIQIQIFDISGRVIHQTSLMRGEKSKALNFRELNGGAYIIEFKNTKGIIRRKVMVIHE